MAKSFMADDRYPRAQRPGEAFRREVPPADQKGDPLSELARLIGTSDPFADPPRYKAAPPAPRIADPSQWPDEEPAPPPASREEPSRAVRFRPEDDEVEAPRAVRHVPGFDDDGTEPEALDTWRPNDPYHHTEGMFPNEPQVFTNPVFADPAPRSEPPRPGYVSRDTSFDQRPEPRWTPPRPSAAPAFDPDDPLGYERDAQAQVQPPAAGYARYEEPAAGSYAAPRAGAGYGVADNHGRDLADVARVAPPSWPPEADPRALHPDAYLRQRSQAAAAPSAGPGAYAAHPDPVARFGDRPSGFPDPHADFGDDPYSPEDLAAHYASEKPARAPARRPRAVLIAAGVFGLCVIGAAGAFGYRLMSSGDSKPAPVIRADAGPNKVVPAGAGDSGKQINDRLADKGAGEKVVSREEQPVEIRDASRPPTPRMVFPNQAAGAAPVATATVQAPPAPAPFAAAAGGEAPKRIRTVTIRSEPGSTGAPAAGSRPAAAPALAAASSPTVAAAPRPGASGPMSLSPAPAAPANTRTSAVAPPSPPPAAVAAGSGGYVVQLSAQKTEAEAQASFRAIQGRYPSQLGGRSPIIRRKDTASGTMFGAQVGPFASRDDAVQLCEGLKSAGGSCFVQRN